ncbi:MAG: Hsp20/alpha crystallin family protein [Opitutae bacterium]|nr:Hsp20/alpha crystallin family protein [Opitutae bacterium]
MHALIQRPHDSRFPRAEARPEHRTPPYDCTDLPQALRLTLYVPGVDASGVDITTRGPDLVVTARKAHHLRANWQTLHLENVQRDYRLSLRLGLGFDYESLQASITGGVLTIVLPKTRPATAAPPGRQRQVA